MSALAAFLCLLGALTLGWRHGAWMTLGRSGSGPVVIGIDAGHGGRDPGAIGRNGLVEKELTLDVAKRLARFLRADGYEVCMTRTKDEDFCDANDTGQTTRKRRDLMTRLNTVSSSGAQLLVSIHANSFPDPVWYGAQTFFYGEREQDRKLAESIQNRLVSELGPNHRLAKSGDIFILRNSEVPAVAVEVGFLSNPGEESQLKSDDYRTRLAQSISKGIADYFADRRLGDSTDTDTDTDADTPAPTSQQHPTTSSGDGPRLVSGRVTQLEPGPDEVVLYFAGPTNNEDSLVPELRVIGKTTASVDVEELASLIVDELVGGPGKGSVLEPILPKSAKVRTVEVRGGVARVDFAPSSLAGFTPGGGVEALAVFSIVNSLTELPGINSVRLSVGGENDVTLAGHVMLDEPFSRKPSMIAGQ